MFLLTVCMPVTYACNWELLTGTNTALWYVKSDGCSLLFHLNLVFTCLLRALVLEGYRGRVQIYYYLANQKGLLRPKFCCTTSCSLDSFFLKSLRFVSCLSPSLLFGIRYSFWVTISINYFPNCGIFWGTGGVERGEFQLRDSTKWSDQGEQLYRMVGNRKWELPASCEWCQFCYGGFLITLLFHLRLKILCS